MLPINLKHLSWHGAEKNLVSEFHKETPNMYFSLPDNTNQAKQKNILLRGRGSLYKMQKHAEVIHSSDICDASGSNKKYNI